MFTGRVSFNDFVFSTLLAGLMLWISIAIPVHIALNCSWPSLLLGLPAVLAVYFLWSYFFHFKLVPTPFIFICHAVFGGVMFLVFSSHVDLALKYFHEKPAHDKDPYEWANTIYLVSVLAVGGVLGYLNAYLKTPKSGSYENAVGSWWALDVDLNEHAYLSPPGFSRFKPLFLGFGIFGLVLVYPLLVRLSGNFDPDTLKLLVIRLGSMCLTLIMYTVLAVSIGEAIRLMRLERRIGAGHFKLYDFDLRLKWRHDYVKHHLPAPIRKLNLRLFNQHVEAYESFQNEIKRSPT